MKKFDMAKLIYIGMPVVIFFFYVMGTFLIPHPNKMFETAVFSEAGIIETVTVLCFLAVAMICFLLWRKTMGEPIGKWRHVYLLIGAGALFIALEECNYGQFYFNFKTPAVIAEVNRKQEFNLHNLGGNQLARLLNNSATLAIPVMFIILPLIAERAGLFYDRTKLAFYFLPKRQLIFFVIIAQLFGWYRHGSNLFSINNAWTRASETKEMYWSIIAILWVLILYKRVLNRSKENGDICRF